MKSDYIRILTDNDTKLIAKRVKAERLRYRTRNNPNKAYSMREFSEIVGISYQTYFNLENGVIKPTTIKLYQLKNIAHVTGCDLGYLTGEINERTRELTDVIGTTGLNEKSVQVLKDNAHNPNGKEFAHKGNDFLNFFIEQSDPINAYIEREIDILKIGRQWESEKGFVIIYSIFKQALKRKPEIPSLKIYFDTDHEKTVIEESIKIFNQYDIISDISSELGVYDEDGKPNAKQLKRIFSYLYESEVKSPYRRAMIQSYIMGIINNYINHGNAE